jgi:hypothetical protein
MKKKEIRRTENKDLITLSPEEWKKIIEVTEAPVEINKNLKKIFSDYQNKYLSLQ